MCNEIIQIILSVGFSFPLSQIIKHNTALVTFSSLLPSAAANVNIAAISAAFGDATPVDVLYDVDRQIKIELPRHIDTPQLLVAVSLQNHRNRHPCHHLLHLLPEDRENDV